MPESLQGDDDGDDDDNSGWDSDRGIEIEPKQQDQEDAGSRAEQGEEEDPPEEVPEDEEASRSPEEPEQAAATDQVTDWLMQNLLAEALPGGRHGAASPEEEQAAMDAVLQALRDAGPLAAP